MERIGGSTGDVLAGLVPRTRTGERATGHAVLKRAMDVALASAVLVLAAPLLLLIAAAIKLDSRGPVLYQQLRHGAGNRVIRVFKFRTMRTEMCDASDAPIRQAVRNDPRVTRIGQFLRRSSLDELPQLLNVLNGTMSLVGPRPHPIAFLEEYGRLIEGYARRHDVKPGITGWAQINGLRGEVHRPDDMRRRIEHDLYYVDHQSCWFDIRILLRTLTCFTSPNAY